VYKIITQNYKQTLKILGRALGKFFFFSDRVLCYVAWVDLELLGSHVPPASGLPSAGTTDAHHCAWLNNLKEEKKKKHREKCQLIFTTSDVRKWLIQRQEKNASTGSKYVLSC
jgi:hypothetical protein